MPTATADMPGPAPSRSPPLRLTVLGATGSVGENTLDLVARNPERFEIIALTACRNAERLAGLAIQHKAQLAVIGDEHQLATLRAALSGTSIRCGAGPAALVEAAELAADCTMAAIVGAAGLAPTFAAARRGHRIALANKECLVSAGEVFLSEVARAHAELIPVDSEHSAAFQALAGSDRKALERIVLTASGGPFRTWEMERIAAAGPEAALRHPNWRMGRKISIDSATMMNKGLELIEAFHLFPVAVDQLGIVVHPQSVVHCLVHFADGSVLAQLAPPDMRTPIAYALAWPDRMPTPVARLDLADLGTLTFEAPDEVRFPALAVAREALQRGGAAPCVLNAANELAVEAFLEKRIGFLDIAAKVAATLEAAEARGFMRPLQSLDDVLAADGESRKLARSLLAPHIA
jgi:1-deoxy-D-xylulose-5-phosphate reductoisomerase